MSCQETVQTRGHVWGICWQRVDTISTCKCVITAVSWFQVNQIWKSLVFLPHLLIFAGLVSWGTIYLRVAARVAGSSWLHQCEWCDTGMLATVAALGSISTPALIVTGADTAIVLIAATPLHPSGIILWIVKVTTFVLDLLMVSQKISLSHWEVLTECMVASVTKLSAW